MQLNLSGLTDGINTLSVSTANPNNMADQVPTNDDYSRSSPSHSEWQEP
ncbi:MAG: hypothetical protein R2825_25770 [Saprospiraceae bacterium]